MSGERLARWQGPILAGAVGVAFVVGVASAGVGHEINNPLAAQMASQGFARDVVEALLVRIRSGKPLAAAEEERELRQAGEALRDALVGSQRIARIVRDLVAFGRSDGRRERVHLRDAVDAGIRWVPASLGGDVTIAVEDRGAPDVRGVAGQLAQVMLNLVVNACQSAGDGRRPSVKVTLGPGSPGMARLEVKDEGTGIPPEVLARIFDPFFTTSPVGQGSGLGLSICHAIVTGHGGKITATSEPGRGATFRIELPAA
jgi:signal transduction histidine kinase